VKNLSLGHPIGLLSPVVAGLVPVTPIILLSASPFGVAGTSPATTPVRG
jgi:hypothetical protein